VKVAGVPTRTIRVAEDGWTVEVIDQTRLPFELVQAPLRCLDDAAEAIREMRVRGAPLIGVTAAYGVCLALREDSSDAALERAVATLRATRPTGVNLRWALDEMRTRLAPLAPKQRLRAAYQRAEELCDADVAACRAIGKHGLPLLEKAQARQRSPQPLNVLTHCNAGWLACVDWGTALAPIYRAHDGGMPVHVWVDETRPRNQGASLTAWELVQHGVPHTVIVDNAGGHLMQRGQVDLCLVGTDRTTVIGDVCNKIGTYLKALAAHDNSVPFYVAVPSSSIDWDAGYESGEIPIEERDGREVSHLWGRTAGGERVEVALLPEQSGVANHAFDVTPARLVTALVTERGVCAASREGLMGLYAERRDPA
jgi:methylthioribose-1-phosphate isomerase